MWALDEPLTAIVEHAGSMQYLRASARTQVAPAWVSEIMQG